MIRIKIKSFTEWLLFSQYCQEPDLELNQTSMVELFCQKKINGCFRWAFFHLEDRIKVMGRVRQVVVLYSNNCKRICLDGLNIGDLCL